MEATERDGELFNPYAPPESDLTAPRVSVQEETGDGLWRAGHLLVMSKGARLPDRCIRCNRPIPPMKIDDQHVWLKKVSPEILADLPDAPFDLRP